MSDDDKEMSMSEITLSDAALDAALTAAIERTAERHCWVLPG